MEDKQRPIREVASLLKVLIQKEIVEQSKIQKVEENAGWFG